jgi:hypothetical protein
LRRTTEPATPAPTRTTTFVRPMPACASAMAARRPRVTGRGGGGGGNPSSGGPDEVRPREALSWSGGEGGGVERGREGVGPMWRRERKVGGGKEHDTPRVFSR